MRNRVIAILLILLIIGAGITALYLFQSPDSSEVELGLENSDDHALAIINEFRPDSNPDNEFVEIYVYGDSPLF